MTQDELKDILHYDPDTGVFTRVASSSCKPLIGTVAGHYNGLGYVRINCFGHLYQAHRLAWLYVYGVLPTDEIDHINQDGTDNRIRNLRLVSSAENKHNIKQANKNNKSGYRGVSPWRGRWRAVIGRFGPPRMLGIFDTAEEASAAYEVEAAKFLPIKG